ncbi:hypothetical protein LLG95_06110 [bacterium]|nr:hypothetical protein [bacterium]
MQLPSSPSENPRNAQAVAALLERVRRLDADAKKRLNAMLDDEMDLPYLDAMEREYAQFFKTVCPDQASLLRGRFVKALNEQRQNLVGMVRNVLHEQEKSLHNAQPDFFEKQEG